jgi:L-rhamnose isomerase
VSTRAFLDEVLQQNVQMALEEPGDMRCAVNAVLTIDALAGMLYVELKRRNDPVVADFTNDDQYRDLLAEKDNSFRVLRDLAASYKHGELTFPKPRLVKSPKQVNRVVNSVGLFQCGDRVGSTVLIVILSDGSWKRASNVIADSFRLLKRLA